MGRKVGSKVSKIGSKVGILVVGLLSIGNSVGAEIEVTEVGRIEGISVFGR